MAQTLAATTKQIHICLPRMCQCGDIDPTRTYRRNVPHYRHICKPPSHHSDGMGSSATNNFVGQSGRSSYDPVIKQLSHMNEAIVKRFPLNESIKFHSILSLSRTFPFSIRLPSIQFIFSRSERRTMRTATKLQQVSINQSLL